MMELAIKAGALIRTNTDGTVSAEMLNRTEHWEQIPNLNALRLLLTEQPFIPKGDMDDFGRGSIAVRYAMLAALLTAADHGGNISTDTGIIGWNGRGCTKENLRYWQDYTGNDKIAGRGGLFVATLPTIPYCEAAITLGCHGASAYFHTEADTAELFTLLSDRAGEHFIAGEITEDSACMLLLSKGKNDIQISAGLPSLEALFHALKKDLPK